MAHPVSSFHRNSASCTHRTIIHFNIHIHSHITHRTCSTAELSRPPMRAADRLHSLDAARSYYIVDSRAIAKDMVQYLIVWQVVRGCADSSCQCRSRGNPCAGAVGGHCVVLLCALMAIPNAGATLTLRIVGFSFACLPPSSSSSPLPAHRDPNLLQHISPPPNHLIPEAMCWKVQLVKSIFYELL